MKLISCISSNIKSFGYDPQAKIMEVNFMNGSKYHYFDVPEEIFLQMQVAESKGRFLNLNIKSQGFKYQKI